MKGSVNDSEAWIDQDSHVRRDREKRDYFRYLVRPRFTREIGRAGWLSGVVVDGWIAGLVADRFGRRRGGGKRYAEVSGIEQYGQKCG